MDTRTGEATHQVVAANRIPRKWRAWFMAIIGILIAGIIAWVLFAPDPIEAEVTLVTQGTMQVTIDNQGQVRVHDKYIVAAPVAAELQRIDLHEGDPIKKHQPVAVLNPLPLDSRQRQEALARLDAVRSLAQEALQRTQRAYNDMQFAAHERSRIERMVEGKFVSPQAAEKAITAEKSSQVEWNAARSREQAALADVKAAEAAVNAFSGRQPGGTRQMQLTSPVDGYVLKVHEKSVRTVAAGTPLLTLGDPTRYEIVVDVLSTDAVKVKPGHIMLLDGWGGGKTLTAKVRVVEPVAFTKVSTLGVEEQRVNVIADPVDPLGPLGDGYRIEAHIVIWSKYKVTKVAGSSLFRVGEKWHLFTVEKSRATEREVQVGQRNQNEAQILSGVNPGAVVIRYPSNQITDGSRISMIKH